MSKRSLSMMRETKHFRNPSGFKSTPMVNGKIYKPLIVGQSGYLHCTECKKELNRGDRFFQITHIRKLRRYCDACFGAMKANQ